MNVRVLDENDRAALRAFLLEDPWNNVYLLSILDWYGIATRRARFWGAFADGALIGALAEGREVHCWFAAIAVAPAAVAARLGRELAPDRAAVLLGREDLLRAAFAELPPRRLGRTARMIFSVSYEGIQIPRPAHPVREATEADLRGLVNLYEGYEMDGYPTRRHLFRALAERIRWAKIYIIERNGQPVAAQRLDACAAEVCMGGGLTTHPAYRGQGFGLALRCTHMRDMEVRGIKHCGIRDPRNPFHRASFQRPAGWWLIANLELPPPARWRTLVQRVRAYMSPWDRPCERRPMRWLEGDPGPPQWHRPQDAEQ